MNNTTVSSNWTRTTSYDGPQFPVDDRVPMVDKATSDLVQDVIYCGFLPVLMLLGTTGNILSCIVLLIQGLKDSTNIYLFTLTISDTIYLLITGVRRIGCIIGKFNPLLGNNLYMVTLPQMKPTAITFSRLTGVLTMLISIERCIAVTKPLKVKQWFRPKRVWCMIGVIGIVCIAFLFPVFLTMDLKWMTEPRSGSTMYYVSLSSFYKDNIEAMNVYINLFLIVLFRFVPLVFIFTCSVTTIIALKKSSSFQKSSSSAKNDKVTKVTKMMLTISIGYVAFNIPATIHQILVLIYPEYNLRGFQKNMFYLVSAFGQLVEVFNSSWNFIIYFALSEKFSVILKQLFCSRCNFGKRGGSHGKSSSGEDTKETRLTKSKTSSQNERNDNSASLQNTI